MEQLNRIELRGTVGTTRMASFSGRKVLNCTLVTEFVYKDKSGNPVIDTQWHNLVLWENEKFPPLETIVKGARLYAVGRLRSRAFSGSDGQEKVAYEVLVSKAALIGGDEPFSQETN